LVSPGEGAPGGSTRQIARKLREAACQVKRVDRKKIAEKTKAYEAQEELP